MLERSETGSEAAPIPQQRNFQKDKRVHAGERWSGVVGKREMGRIGVSLQDQTHKWTRYGAIAGFAAVAIGLAQLVSTKPSVTEFRTTNFVGHSPNIVNPVPAPAEQVASPQADAYEPQYVLPVETPVSAPTRSREERTRARPRSARVSDREIAGRDVRDVLGPDSPYRSAEAGGIADLRESVSGPELPDRSVGIPLQFKHEAR